MEDGAAAYATAAVGSLLMVLTLWWWLFDVEGHFHWVLPGRALAGWMGLRRSGFCCRGWCSCGSCSGADCASCGLLYCGVDICVSLVVEQRLAAVQFSWWLLCMLRLEHVSLCELFRHVSPKVPELIRALLAGWPVLEGEGGTWTRVGRARPGSCFGDRSWRLPYLFVPYVTEANGEQLLVVTNTLPPIQMPRRGFT